MGGPSPPDVVVQASSLKIFFYHNQTTKVEKINLTKNVSTHLIVNLKTTKRIGKDRHSRQKKMFKFKITTVFLKFINRQLFFYLKYFLEKYLYIRFYTQIDRSYNKMLRCFGNE